MIHLDEQFERLHSEEISAFENDLGKSREEAEWIEGRNSRLRRDRPELLALGGLDIEHLEAMQAQDEEDGAREVAVVRRELASSAPDLRGAAAARHRGMMASQGRSMATLYGATLLAPVMDRIDSNEGERGNPWVLPSNPGRVDVWDRSSNGGWGCWAVASGPGPRAVFWYYLVPQSSGPWWFWAYTGVHGFYIVRADDSWYNCKTARVRITGSVDVWQTGHWFGRRDFPVLSEGGDNINRYGRVDTAAWFQYPGPVGAGDPVWVKVTVQLDAFANGGGAYAEVNCSEGNGNYLEPILLIAGP